MGTTFVQYRERGFWMRDGVLELWLRLLALHLEEPSASRPRAGPIREGWLLASRGYFTGCVPVRLDEATDTTEGEALVRGAIASLLASLARAPAGLDRGTLNLLGIEGEFLSDFPRDALVEVGRAWIDLLDGRVGGPASDSSFMPGSGR